MIKICLFLFLINLTNCIRTNDFCISKQIECKGFYDIQHKYQTECKKIKCDGKFIYECGFSICSINKASCHDYYLMDYHFMKNSRYAINQIRNDKTNIKSFNKNIKYCKNKIYQFNSTDTCLNGKGCIVKRKILKGLGYYYEIRKIDCKCPIESSFKCDKYCTISSISCDYLKLIENQMKYSHFNKCGNDNKSFTLSYSSFW